MANELGMIIKRRRVELMLQQRDVAKRIGVTNVTLCKVQTGERRLSRKRLYLLADVLEVDYLTLLEYSNYDINEEYNKGLTFLSELSPKNLIGIMEIFKKEESMLNDLIAILIKSNDEDKVIFSNTLNLIKDVKHISYNQRSLTYLSELSAKYTIVLMEVLRKESNISILYDSIAILNHTNDEEKIIIGRILEKVKKGLYIS